VRGTLLAHDDGTVMFYTPASNRKSPTDPTSSA